MKMPIHIAGLHIAVVFIAISQLISSELMEEPWERTEHAGYSERHEADDEGHDDDDEHARDALILTPPPNGSEQPDIFFSVHQWTGLIANPVLLLFFLSVYVRSKQAQTRLFPWLSRHHRSLIWSEVGNVAAAFARFKVPDRMDTQHLARAVQGLGFLLMFWLACSGAMMWLFQLPAQNEPWLAEVHELAVTPFWLYLIGHGAMGVAHWINDNFGHHKTLQTDH